MTIAVFLGSLLGAMALGMPIAFALLVCGLALMWQLDNFDTQILAQNLFSGADSFPLLAVPFFMLTGEVMTSGGLSRRIVAIAVALCGHYRGGLGYVAIAASILMASMSGSAVADTAALGAILIPMMRGANYDVGRASGLIAAGGIIAPMMPLSIPFIVFGVISGVSIGKLFTAGIVPGFLMALALVAAWWLVARKDDVKPLPRQPANAVGKAVIDGFWALMIPVIVLGGIKAGVFTPTEAAVVAATYSLLVSLFIYRELKFSMLYRVFLAAGKTTAIVMFLVAAATISAWLIAVADLPGMVAELLAPFIDNKILLMFIIMLIVIAVGTALDIMPTILILTPVLMPVVKQAGIDPVYFGVMFILNNAIGLITPPVGTVLNVIAGVAKISLDDTIKGSLPFLIAHLFLLLLLTLFPALVLAPLRFMQ
ncbi:TRAP transporter large permease subunit [Xanthobacteraceae bacterium Astr-EGSB]|uniref:TRAP transporter large permease subunit n=1 Tax=Astrobacterium formosum TaxID=3069710 RepID=UPI0027B2E645|nr:TRAP transporter large permease subunit [Xanthobacteraceae bacterium Astr-EGSB]